MLEVKQLCCTGPCDFLITAGSSMKVTLVESVSEDKEATLSLSRECVDLESMVRLYTWQGNLCAGDNIVGNQVSEVDNVMCRSFEKTSDGWVITGDCDIEVEFLRISIPNDDDGREYEDIVDSETYEAAFTVLLDPEFNIDDVFYTVKTPAAPTAV